MSEMLSVIIPVYNTKEELGKCLSSICNQTYKTLEIICVDDGSTDGSGEIVDKFAIRDSRVRVIHQQNAGESAARNTGLRMATGDFIAFCDCDDWLDIDMYEVMMQTMTEENLDMVCASWYKEFDTESIEIKNALPVLNKTFGQKQFLKYLYMRDSYRGFAYMWNKIYKAEILRDTGGGLLLFDETLRLGGDVLYLAKAALNTNRVKYIDKGFYHYYQRRESGCHTQDALKLRDWLRAYEIVIDLFERSAIDGEIVNYVKRFLAYHSSNAVEVAVAQNEELMKQEFQKIMKENKEVYIRLNGEYPKRIERYLELMEK